MTDNWEFNRLSLKTAGIVEGWLLDVGVTVLHRAWICDTQLKNLLFLVSVVSTCIACLVKVIRFTLVCCDEIEN
jgi:hypothetical protein